MKRFVPKFTINVQAIKLNYAAGVAYFLVYFETGAPAIGADKTVSAPAPKVAVYLIVSPACTLSASTFVRCSLKEALKFTMLHC